MISNISQSSIPLASNEIGGDFSKLANLAGLDAKLTLPISESGQASGNSAAEVQRNQLQDGFKAEGFYHYDQAEGGTVFNAPVAGAKTSANTKYARTELRQMNNGEKSAWTIASGGKMTTSFKVTELPTEADGGPGRIIVNQIHGENDELFRLYYDANGDMYYANEITGTDGAERLFYFENAVGERLNVNMNETVSTSVEVVDNRLIVQVETADGLYNAVATDGVDPTEIHSDWHGDSFYFKAGVYQGVNTEAGHEHQGSGAGEAVFFDITMDGTGGNTRGSDVGTIMETSPGAGVETSPSGASAPETSTEFSPTGSSVDPAAMEALAQRANAIFFQVMEMNLAYEEATAGAKAAKAKSGQVSG